MRKRVLSLAVVMFVLASMGSLYAASLAGVTMPDTAQVGGKSLVLNGMGIRSKYMVKVYVAGLYLEQKSSDANAIIKADAPKQVVMHFLHGVTKSQMADGFTESFNDNSPDAMKTMKPDIDRVLAAQQALNSGDEMAFTYVPGTGTTMSVNGQSKLTIAGPEFAQVMMAVWLGPKPPTADVKTGMLGH